jgi:6-phosphogluconolactonase
MDKSHDNSRGIVRWISVADVTALWRAAVDRIVDAASRAIERRGQFLIVLAGGDTPRSIYGSLCGVDTDWSRWHVYFGDERCLPADDPERNSRMAADVWLDHVAIPRNQIFAIHAERGAQTAARIYSNTLRGVGDFDLVLLGLGEDGHTASLFPGHDRGVADDAPDALAVFYAPKLPPQRVSLSANRLSRTRGVLFLVGGESKRDAVTQWRRGADIPARAIRPDAGVDVLAVSTLLADPNG